MSHTIWAAGGVLWREAAAGAIEIGVIHRPRYNDWTLPKGKLEPGETLIHTAVREIAEETGYHVRLGRHLRDVRYDIANGRKRVRYWSARAIGGSFDVNHEVDALKWVNTDTARTLLTYRPDRRVVAEFVRLPADLDTLVLVRHAKAGRRSRYRGDDKLRPLDTAGNTQAQALVPILSAFGVTTLHSADRTRCEQTLAPSAMALDVPIIRESALSEEAYRLDPAAAHDRIRELAADTNGGKIIRAVCSQGKVIPPLMSWWTDHDDVVTPKARNRKASAWVIFTRHGRLVAADHVDSPLPQHVTPRRGKTVGG
ncbi:MAG: NUDIX hydrolase [Gordonia sp. (in: high G+C Gram-positive bacteria)]